MKKTLLFILLTAGFFSCTDIPAKAAKEGGAATAADSVVEPELPGDPAYSQYRYGLYADNTVNHYVITIVYNPVQDMVLYTDEYNVILLNDSLKVTQGKIYRMTRAKFDAAYYYIRPLLY